MREIGGMMKRFTCCLIVMLALAATVAAQDSWNIQLASSLTSFWQKSEDLVVVDQYAFVAAGESGLHIVNISDPTRPFEVGSLDLPGYSRSLVVVGDYAYIAAFSAGLRIVDVSDPFTPSEVAHVEMPELVEGVAVSGNYAYVANYRQGLRILDVSDPTEPVQAGFWPLPNIELRNIVVENGYAYLAAEGNGFYIFDISDLTNVTMVYYLNLYHEIWDIAVEDDYLYVVGGRTWSDEGVFIAYDIIDRSNPIEISRVNFNYRQFDIYFDYNMAYVSGDGVHLFDVSDPSNPIEVSHNTRSSAYGTAAVGNSVYVADYFDGLIVYDYAAPTLPVQVGRCGGLWYSECAAIMEDVVYMIDRRSGLYALDVSDPYSLNSLSFYEAATAYHGIAIKNQLVFTANDSELLVFDASDPLDLTPIGFCSGSTSYFEYGEAILLSGDHLFYQSYDGFAILDVADPTSPFEVSWTDLYYTRDFDVSNDYLYAVDTYLGLHVYDVSNPSELIEVTTFSVPGSLFNSVALQGSYAYLADLHAGLRILDVSDPTSPVELNLIEFDFPPSQLEIDGDYLYCSSGNIGLHILSLADPVHPFEIGYHDLTEAGERFCVADGFAFMPDESMFYIFDCNEALPVEERDVTLVPSEFALSAPYPNPFNAATTIAVTLPAAGVLNVAVFNPLGQRVTVVTNTRVAAGVHRYTLDGSALASGTYFVRATVPGQMEESRKVVLVK